MYLKEYFPFYTTYANPLLYEGERMQDKEFNLMKSYYPGTVQHIQEKIEEECDLMDYEGSRLYDEYPDKYMIYHLSCKIRESMQPEISTQAIREDFPGRWSSHRPHTLPRCSWSPPCPFPG